MRTVTGSILLLAVAIMYAASMIAIAIPQSQVRLMGGVEGFFAGVALGLLGLFFLVWGALTEPGIGGTTEPPAPLPLGAKVGMGVGFMLVIVVGFFWLFTPR